jgi:hypothetical protein
MVLYKFFPKNVATAFSDVLNKVFPPLNQTPAANLHRGSSGSFMIIGGRLKAHREVPEWMLSCCSGKGVQKFRFILTYAFYKYALTNSAAC